MVQKKIFQAGLGDVHVAQFDAGSGGEIGDFGDQRTAPVGVEIHPGISHCPGLGHTGKLRQPLDELRRARSQLESDDEATRDRVLQLLRFSERESPPESVKKVGIVQVYFEGAVPRFSLPSDLVGSPTPIFEVFEVV